MSKYVAVGTTTSEGYKEIQFVICPKCDFMNPRGNKNCWKCGYFLEGADL